jgi:hypothetical protein
VDDRDEDDCADNCDDADDAADDDGNDETKCNPLLMMMKMIAMLIIAMTGESLR